MSLLLTALLALNAPAVHPAAAPLPHKVFLTVDEALALAFPGAEIERSTVYLTERQRQEARRLSGCEIASALVHVYAARDAEGKVLGSAYFDAHRVRTLSETVMVAIGPDRGVRRVEICSFDEPLEYVPRESWYAQFVERKLDDELELKRGIRGVTGATLTVRATTSAVRRVLALDQVIAPAGAADVSGPAR